MPDDEFAEVDVHRSRSVLIVASAVSVVVLAAAAIIGVHSWRDTAGRGPAADGATPITPSGSPSSVASLMASASEPAFSPAPLASSLPIVSAAPISSAPAQPSTVPATSRTSPTARPSAGDNDPNLKVTIQASPTHVVLGQTVRVTVTVASAGGLFERPLVLGVSGSDPSDNFSDAQPPCSANFGASCRIDSVLPGHKSSYTFTFVPGPFPGTDGYDDAISATFDYTDRDGRPQQTQQYFGHVFLYNPTSSSAPTSAAPSTTSPPATSPPATSPPAAPPASAVPANVAGPSSQG